MTHEEHPTTLSGENTLAAALHGRTLVLASGSPRRREFFERSGVPFLVRTGDTPENYPDTLHEPEQIVRYLSRLKACAAGLRSPEEIIVGADTIVWAEGRVKSAIKRNADRQKVR